MDLYDAIKGRRSVRKFRPDPVPIHVPGADEYQETSDFLLEDDNQGYHTHSQYRTQYGAEQLHFQSTNGPPEHIDGCDAQGDVVGHRSPDQHIELIEQEGYEDDIDDIQKPYM